MKPNGLEFRIRDGALTLGVIPRNSVVDIIWRAVEESIDAGVTVEQFRREAAQAWDYELDKQRKNAAREWEKR